MDTARFVLRVQYGVIEHVYFTRARHVLHDCFFETKVVKTPDAVYQTICTPGTQTVRVTQPLSSLASWTYALFARARDRGLHIVLVPAIGSLCASARHGVKKRVALELFDIYRLKCAIEGVVDCFCVRSRRTRLRLYARVLFFDLSQGRLRQRTPRKKGERRRGKQQHTKFAHALRSCEPRSARSEERHETNDEYWGKNILVDPNAESMSDSYYWP